MGKVEDAEATMRANLEKNTDKSFETWLMMVRKKNLAKHGEIVAWLKTEHSLGHGYANMIALRSRESADAPPSSDDLIGAQYAGAKTALRPIYDAVTTAVEKLGSDVEISPKKTCVSYRRNKQFALIQASTATRVDIGINLRNVPAGGRLEASGSFNAMVTHRVRIDNVKQIDAELKGWLKQAYEAA
jgi:predicted transport protein